MIEINNISKSFGSLKAVDSVSFKVNKGDILAFLGPNGAGKTTIIKMLAGFLKEDSGEILIENQSYHKEPISIKSKIGYMPENTPLYKDMTAREYLKFIAEVYNVENIEEELNKTIEIANLKAVENKLIETYSKGYKSRLSFASTIIHNPSILLLDEPTDGLDPNQKKELRKLINDLSKEKAIIISTHLLEEAETLCNRAIIISEGKILIDSTPYEILKLSNQNTFDEAFSKMTKSTE